MFCFPFVQKVFLQTYLLFVVIIITSKLKTSEVTRNINAIMVQKLIPHPEFLVYLYI